MTIGLVGRKVGMTRIFTDDGVTLPVTVLDVSDNRVTQIKTADTDGYAAVQVAFGKRRANRVSKAMAGHFAKAGVEAGTELREFRVAPEAVGELKVGSELKVDMFAAGQKVDVAGVTIGKGFAGVIKRHHFSSNRASHGNSVTTKAPGSIGMAQDPGRVFPGKRMSGHLGNVNRTVQLLEIARVDAERSLIMVKGSVPGAKNSAVVVRPSVKAKAQKSVDASETLFGREYNEALVHQVVVAYGANGRQGTRQQKTRSEVRHSTKKPWRQKGTGRARAGMTSSPLWRGGGRIFPNKPDENFTQKLNRKMYRAGMASILSQLVREQRLSVVDALNIEQPKTRLLAGKLRAMGLAEVLILTDKPDENLFLSARNLPNVLVL